MRRRTFTFYNFLLALSKKYCTIWNLEVNKLNLIWINLNLNSHYTLDEIIFQYSNWFYIEGNLAIFVCLSPQLKWEHLLSLSPATYLTPKWRWSCWAWERPRWCCGATSWRRAPGGPGQGASSGRRRARPGPAQPGIISEWVTTQSITLYLDHQHRNTDPLEVLLRWNHSHQLLQ